MIKLRIPSLGRIASAVSKKPSNDSIDYWIDDYLNDEDDDDFDDDEDEDEDDFPYLVYDPMEGLFDDEDDSESMDTDDAAYAWMSRGKDEDYMFGYSKDELEGSV